MCLNLANYIIVKAYAECECRKLICPIINKMGQYELNSIAMSYSYCFGTDVEQGNDFNVLFL